MVAAAARGRPARISLPADIISRGYKLHRHQERAYGIRKTSAPPLHLARFPDTTLFRIRTAPVRGSFPSTSSRPSSSPVLFTDLPNTQNSSSSPASMPLRPASTSLLGRLSQVALRESSSSSSNLLPRAGNSSTASALVLPRSSLIARSSPPHRGQQRQLRPYSSKPSSSPSPHNDRSQFKVLPFIILVAIGSGSYVLLVKSRAAARQQQQLEQQ